MKTPPVGLAALIAGCAIAVVGLGAYQAWWTIAIAIGGFAVFSLTQHQTTPARALAIGSAVAGSILLAGMSLFLLYGSLFGGVPWFAASIASVVTAVLLVLYARRLFRHRQPRDSRRR